MVSIRSSRLAVATVLLSASATLAAVNTTKPVLAAGITLPGLTSSKFGCYGSSQGMTWAGSFNFMTSSICQIYCLNLNLAAMGTSAGTDCYCGEYAPPLAAKLDDSKCTSNCTGYGLEMCGGSNSTGGVVILSIWNDQLESSISNSPDSLSVSSSSSTSTTSSSATAKPTSATSTTPAVVTVTNAGGSIVTVVASESAAASNSGGVNKAGVAAGVVVGVIAMLGIGGGVWFFMRQKRRREVEEEHKRQVAVSSFIAGGKPGSSGGNSIPDTRLDPAILRDRRMSDGSIMDNQDYSRRILKVTNA